MSDTARIQYVFLDVVKFTQDRSVEAQADVVGYLNAIVTLSLQQLGLEAQSTILIPTGDGMAIALIAVSGVDLHLQLALRILAGVLEHNQTTEDARRRFEVRIGINENTDNIVTDINGRKNVAGMGISMAQRVMDQADGGQLLVGGVVYEALRQRERYMSNWKAFTGKGKHGITFPVYQFVSNDHPGLNIQTPSAFAVRPRAPERMTEQVAYYVANAIVNREFLVSKKGDPTRDEVATVLLWFLTEDAVAAANTSPHETPTTKTWKAGKVSFSEQYEYYDKMDFWSLMLLSDSIETQYLSSVSEVFERSGYLPLYWLVSEAGVRKLINEWPAVANLFGIDQTAPLANRTSPKVGGTHEPTHPGELPSGP